MNSTCDGAVPRLVPLEVDAGCGVVRLGAEEVDADLLEGWVVECGEQLQHAECALLRLESDARDVEAAHVVLGCFHTIKGTAVSLGLDRVGELAHRAETLMARVGERGARPDGATVGLALRSVDVIAGLVRAVDGVLAGRPVAEPAAYGALCAALDAANAGPPDGRAAGTGGSESAAEAVGPEASTRVRTERLERLMHAVGALAAAHDAIAADALVREAGGEELARKVASAGRIVREIEELSSALRLVPLRGTAQKVARVVRDAAARRGKRVAFTVVGEDIELDRSVADAIGEALVHLARNAVDHGIESEAERLAAGKPGRGAVHLAARLEGGAVVVRLSDDGRGLCAAGIARNAADRGLIDGTAELSEREVFDLIYAPGVSTAAVVTELSGRGIGMAVVRRNVTALRGGIEIESAPGRGATFTIRLPSGDQA